MTQFSNNYDLEERTAKFGEIGRRSATIFYNSHFLQKKIVDGPNYIIFYHLKMFYFKKSSSLILIFLAVFAGGFSVLHSFTIGLDMGIGFAIIKMFNHTAFLRASGRRQFFYGK